MIKQILTSGLMALGVLAASFPLQAMQEGSRTKSPIHVEAVAVTTLVDDIDAGTGGLSVDQEGNLYTADFGWQLNGQGKGGDKIFKVTPQGKVSLFTKGMRGASGNTMDAAGNLYQSSIGGHFISKISPKGEATVLAKSGLANPVGIALGREGELYVCNCGSNSIQKITPDGTSTRFCQSLLLNCPNGICRGPDGVLYVCNFGNGDVIEITKEGKASRLATLPGNNNGHLTFFADKLYVVSRGGHRIIKVGLDGTATYFAGNGQRGKKDGSPDDCQFSLPNSIYFSPDHKYLYVNETSPTSGNPVILGPTRIRRIELKITTGGPAPKEKVVVQPAPQASGIQKAQQLLAQQKFLEAEKILRPIVKASPQNPGATYLLGYSLHGAKKYREAREMFQKSALSNQFKAGSLYNIACAYSLEKKTDEAINYLEQAIQAGFKNFDQMKKDTDLDPIRDDERFKKLFPQ